MSSPIIAAPRSRNGLRQACEPCRRRKLACDHHLPVCDRCQRGKTPSRCIYIDRYGPRVPPSPARSISISTRTTNLVGQSSVVTSPVRSGGDVGIRGEMGYLGATSVSSFTQETQKCLSLVQHRTPSQTDQSSPSAHSYIGTTSAKYGPPVSKVVENALLDMAVDVLGSIPDPQNSNSLLQKALSPVDGWVRQAVFCLADSTWETFGTDLRGAENRPRRLLHMAQLLSENTARPLHEDCASSDEWLGSFSGTNLRWEAVGIMFIHWAIGSMSLHDDSPLLLSSPGSTGSERRKAMRARYVDCVHSCLDLCGRTHPGNTLLAYLYQKHAHLSSAFAGDASLLTSRITAESIAILTHIGLHVTPPSAVQTISLSTEIRRRLFAQAFIIDKVAAIFTGRPPLLRGSYCSTPLPLDLSDEDLFSLGRDLSIEPISRLTNDGWNTDGKVHSATLLRARAMMSFIRDEILEMALAVNQRIDSQALDQLKDRQAQLYKQLPPGLVYRDGDASDKNQEPRILFAKILARLDHLQNLFFILRLLVKARASPEDGIQLLETSFEMLSITLRIWTGGCLHSLRVNFDWMVVSYAGPAAGVLCSALVNPSSALNGRAPPSASVSRADVVLQLGLLIGFIEWISPGSPNAGLCASMTEIVRLVLDHSLNAPPATQAPEADAGQPLPWQDLGRYHDISESLGNFYDFEPLNTFEWLQWEQPAG
ncbi:hypothetical protein VTK73DRAFT_2841 [Phialemonium thermophilum]|uniref:Zn(2)-C6 fungal-type domain-containing protein n=1 Tax=Phialemonium thermophilum TaxID=223376 RepID=A0ABR3X2S9_9PEZI